ncbi:hypothetical protein SteCoe_9463 [Stentor coeruleus]|uniref:PX domain-containing protein n=1 Tax=Stentor coeruleus TaxID=5963 RepID=A0A1R2CHX1_9CILI|nr:hypothetical protein SteCoe_9463 [Stentor coeruleus]
MDSDDDESYIISAERKAKQNYLTEEILYNHYDPELFMMFCSKIKEPDVDNWTFEELVVCVQDFKMTYRRGTTLKDVLEEEQKNQKPEPKRSESAKKQTPEPVIDNKLSKPKTPPKTPKAPKITENIIDPLKMHNENHQENPEKRGRSCTETTQPKTQINKSLLSPRVEKIEHLEETFPIRCRQLEANELSTCKNLEFILGEPELVEGGFLSSKFYLYPVKTLPLGWECKRKYAEFIWLQEILQSSFPNFIIPAIPNIKQFSKPENDKLSSRKFFLIKFLISLSKNKILLSLPVVQDFLFISSREKFIDLTKSFKKKTIKPDNLHMLYNNDEFLQCSVSDMSEQHGNLSKFIVNQEAIEKKLKKQTSILRKDMRIYEEDMKNIAKSFKELESLHDGFIFKSENCKMLGNIGSGYEKISQIEGERIKMIKEHFHLSFKYSSLEKEKIKDMLKERDGYYNEFLKAETKGKNLEHVRNFYGYYNLQALSETKKAITEDIKNATNNFTAFAKKSANLASDFHTVWSNLINNLK